MIKRELTKQNKNKHYSQQMRYFEDEFSNIPEYKLTPWQSAYINRIQKYIIKGSRSNKTLLDIAAGTGYVSVEMAKKGMTVIATDLSPTAVKHLIKYKKKMNLSHMRVIKCYAEKIPLKNKSVDIIVANAILEHIPDEQAAIAEWRRLLKPKGLLLITVPLKYRYLWPFFWPVNYIHDKRIGHLRRYDRRELARKFDMKLVDYFYTGHIQKVLVAIASFIMDVSDWEKKAEKYDHHQDKNRYGASNVTVVLCN